MFNNKSIIITWGTGSFGKHWKHVNNSCAIASPYLHCTTEYPAPFAEVNLRAMDTLVRAFGLSVGYSDHTPGIHISLAAVARGARIIEKHFTSDRSLPGPDHQASLEPEELHQLVQQIREIEQALGDGIKRPTASEWKNRYVARKSLVAAQVIKVGEVFTEENLTCKRPGTGVSPFEYWQIIGTIVTRNYSFDETLNV
ncbi:N-acetylneuraminate synthase family protein [Laspinema sp. D1]|uniref:N-acetylneuraminate synthase family protein n=1 Tax=Laspinema palackyanum D2a TaxID=2953684 RepID=A0ABT2MUW6_9CYAN|nr:N-acetylneuraminate synthase family protein [Laspinema sp. D2a]